MIMAGYSNVGSTNSGGASRRAASGECGEKGSSPPAAGAAAAALPGGLGKAGGSGSSNNSEANSSGPAWSAAAAGGVAAPLGGSGGGISSCSSSCLSSCMPSSSSEKSDSAVPEAGVRSSGAGSSSKSSSGTSGGSSSCRKRFVGVRQRPSGRWVAEIKDTTQKIRLWLGTFDTAEDAAKAYDEAACMLRGANTRTNFVTRSTDVPPATLHSKAARLLQLRRNAATKSGPGAYPREPRLHQQQQNQKRLGKSLMNEDYAVCRFESNSSLGQHPQPLSSYPPSHSVAAAPACEPFSLAPPQGPTAMELSDNFSAETVSKAESSSLESSAEEMRTDLDESTTREHNATTSNTSKPSKVALPDLPSAIAVKQEVPNGYCTTAVAEPISMPRMEPVKERSFSPAPPPLQKNQPFVETAGLSCSGLSTLDDVDRQLREESVYSSSPFDFSADIGSGLDLGVLNIPLPSDASDQMRRMPSYERGIPEAVGAQDCLIPSPCSSSWGTSMMFSPSLTLPCLEFGRSSPVTASAAYRASSPRVRIPSDSGASGGGGSAWGNSVMVPNSAPAASSGPAGNAETLGSPRDDALWQNFELPSLCPLSVC